ncbi:MAG: hypothetical protein Q7S23_00285 [bacterium]|nr:hypothetical protein [bacterium]
MAEPKKEEHGGSAGGTPKKKPPPKKSGEERKPEHRIDEAPKAGAAVDAFKLVPLNPVAGQDGWVVNINVYHARPKEAFYAPEKAEVDVFDPLDELTQGKIEPTEVGKFGTNIVLPYARHDRTVQLSVRSVTMSGPDGIRKENPDVHTMPVFLPGQPYRRPLQKDSHIRLKTRVSAKPERGFWDNLKAAVRGHWKT